MRSNAEEKRWESLFRDARVDPPKPGFVDDLERRLREETAKRAPAAPPARGRVLRWGGLAAAAAVLLAVGLAFGLRGDGEPDPEIPYCAPATVVAVHATPPVRARERDWSLSELVGEADLILAGQFVVGGHENSFRVDRVLLGGDPGGVIALLTSSGLRCPAPAVPRAGAFAVVFAVREDGGLAVPSRAWLRQFRDATARDDLADAVAARLAPDAADVIARRIREVRRADPDAPFDRVRKLVRDIGVVGGIRGVVALMELHLEFGDKDVHGQLIDALAEIRLRSAGVPDLAAEMEKLREAMEAAPEAFSSEEKKRLLERLMEMSNASLPDRFVPVPPEKIEDPGALRDRLADVNAALRRSVTGGIAADPDGLRAGAEAVRAALAREVALDDRRTAHQRAGAVSIAIRHAPDALSGAEVGALVGDADLPWELRRLAVELAAEGRHAGAVPALLDLVTAEEPDGDGPEPRALWHHGATGWGMLRYAAIEALGEIGDRRAVPILEALLAGDAAVDAGLERTIRAALRGLGRKR